MNARELLALIDDCGMIELINRSGRDNGGWIQETILRALRLLAAAEGGEAERSKLVEDLRTEADLCRNETAEDIAELLDDAASAIIAMSSQFNALKEAHAAALVELARVRDALLGVKEYRDKNPLGGPAKVFDAMADQIRAGDDFNKVIADYGWCPVSRAERAESALAERDAEIAGLKEDAADSTAAYGLLFKSHGRLRDHSEALREAGQQLTSDCRDKDWLRDWDRAVSAYRAEFKE